MSIKILLGDTFPRFTFSRTEAKILDTIITEKNGNAYSLWKASGLKHYPTVLRALKKLEKNRLAQVSSEKGTRGERIYTPTLIGALVSCEVKGEEKKKIEIIEKNSSLFRELYKIDKDNYWVGCVVREIMLDLYRKREPRSLDEVIKKEMEETLDDYVLNRLNEDPEWITRLSKVEWIRPLALEVMENEMNRLKSNLEALIRLEEIFTSK